MPHLAFDIGFCAQLGKLQGTDKQGVFDAWEKFERLTLDQLFKDPGLKLESLKQAKDPHIRTIRIAQGTRGVVLAPDSGDTFVLLRVMILGVERALPADRAVRGRRVVPGQGLPLGECGRSAARELVALLAGTGGRRGPYRCRCRG
jgi:hypothetical protein